jgi:uncharacterized repeat protein (TIGR02543 family)
MKSVQRLTACGVAVLAAVLSVHLGLWALSPQTTLVAEAAPAAQSGWGTATAGVDGNGRPFAQLENSQIRVRYGYDTQLGEYNMIDFVLKTSGNQDQAGTRGIDASANRGYLSRAIVNYNGDDYKSIWLEWENGWMIQEVTIFPNSPYVQIDYYRYGVNIVDIGQAGGSTLSGTYGFAGGDTWIRDYEAVYPGSYFNSAPGDGYNDPTDGGALNQNGWIVGGISGSNGNGWGRVMPVNALNIVKLLRIGAVGDLRNRGFEWFAFYNLTKQPFRSYMYAVTGGDQISNGLALTTSTTYAPPANYRLTTVISPTGAGYINQLPDQTIYPANRVLTITAVPNPGYTFIKWSNARTGSTNPNNLQMTSNKTLVAEFAFTGYTLNTSTSGSGTVTKSPNQATYSNNAVVTLTATPSNGWTFVGWSGDLAGNTNPVAVTLNSNRNITALFTQTPNAGWWSTTHRYRVPLQISAAGFERFDKPAEVTLNFTQILQGIGPSGTFDPNSLRVVEVNAQDVMIDTDVEAQFDPGTGYNATTNATGQLTFLMRGMMPANGLRYFHVYFDTTDNGPFTPFSFTSQITVTDNITDANLATFRVQTQNATYFFHKQGGGFTSINDVQSVDWVGYTPCCESAGEYRGLPNTGYTFHPGYTNAVSSLVTNGALRTVISSQSTNGQWKSKWEFFPTYARMTMEDTDADYWFLYEGQPFGQMNKGRDYYLLSDGITRTVGNSYVTTWNGDIPNNEWAYFGDSYTQRTFFLAHHEDDNLAETSWQHSDNMTVFGFGRNGTSCAPCDPLMNAVPQRFTIGFGQGLDLAAKLTNSAYRDLNVTVQGGQALNGPSFVPIGDKSLFNNSLITFTVTANDPDTADLNFSIIGLPSGASFNSTTTSGTFSWTPTLAQVGTRTITFTVSDGTVTDVEAVQITVNNRTPVLNSIGTKLGSSGRLLTFTVSGTDPDGNPLTYSATGLPSGATFNTNTGVFSWTPNANGSQEGSYNITFSVSDTLASDSEPILIEIGPIFYTYLPVIMK